MEEDQKEEIFQSPPDYQSRLSRSGGNGSSAKRYIIIIISLAVVVLIILGVFKFLGTDQEAKTDISPTPTFEVLPTDTPFPTEEISETPEPTKKEALTPSPKPTASDPIDKASGLDRSKLSIHVLNGSGVAGAAKKASDFLEGLGYNVVDYDNADNTDYAQTVIQISSAQSKFLSLLKKDLSGKYTIGSTADAPPASETADAVVIIGKE